VTTLTSRSQCVVLWNRPPDVASRIRRADPSRSCGVVLTPTLKLKVVSVLFEAAVDCQTAYWTPFCVRMAVSLLTPWVSWTWTATGVACPMVVRGWVHFQRRLAAAGQSQR